MAKYTIECDICLGFTHCGAEETNGKGTIELSDEEVKTLVDLIRKKKSTDPGKLRLKKSHPDLYKKLDEAYYDLYYQAEETYWLKKGYYNGDHEYDSDKLQEYCTKNCGYEYHKPDKYYIKENGEVDLELLVKYVEDCNEYKHFSKWLGNYIDSLPYNELCDFCYNHLNAEVNMDDLDYEVHIPKEIIEMAKQPDTDNI